MGVYEKSADNTRVITFKDGQLYSMRTGGGKFQVYPYAKDQFFFDDDAVTLEFNRDKKGEIESVTLKSTRRPEVWLKTDKPLPVVTEIKMDPTVFAGYIGKYELAPEFYISIFSEDEIMYTQATGQQKIELVATDKNKFTLKDTDIKLTMNVSDTGTVESLTLHQNGDHPAKKVE